MRCNKQELMEMASQTPQNFDREGVLVLKERQDSFFRRSEGCSVRWVRLRGNLLFYLKGPEPWYEPMGVIVLGLHQVCAQPQDENGHWPFQIVWENGVCYRMATFLESERSMWLKAIQMAPYDHITSELAALKERLSRVRPVVDIATYRLQKGIVTDMNEVPLCELALSCDNLRCDAHGCPPSPVIVVYVKFSNGLCIKYGTTEIVDTCSNPSFSKTVLFRASDGLDGDATVRLVVYDVRERFSETAVPMGFTALQLTTIQEAQRLRVALVTKENKTVGFVTINGWSLEPSYTGTSPSHSTDKNSIDIAQRMVCHRRSQSLPPRLGLKLKFPSYGNLMKQNFMNSLQVTYRFHSGLGGDITVHEIMAEPKICYQMPIQLLDIYIQREKELLEELLSIGEMRGAWRNRQMDLIGTHVSLLKHYCHSKRCMQNVDAPYFKASSKKDESSLEFAPTNLHLQRMWVYNDTLNKAGLHDVVTAGAFAAHAHRSERTGGLIRLVQQVKDVTSSDAAMHSAAASRIQADHDVLVAAKKFRDEVTRGMERVIVLLQAKQWPEVFRMVEVLRRNAKSTLSLWNPSAVEESLSFIGWPKNTNGVETESQTMSTLIRMTEQLSMYDINSDYENLDVSSSSSSKEASPTVDFPSLSSSVPNICPNNGSKNRKEKVDETKELQFHNDYFNCERSDRLNNSFRSVRSAKVSVGENLSFEMLKMRAGSLKYDFKSSASLEQVSYRCLMESLSANDKRKNLAQRRESLTLPTAGQLDAATRQNNLAYLKSVSTTIEEALGVMTKTVLQAVRNEATDLVDVERSMDRVRVGLEEPSRWQRAAHAAMRLRLEAPHKAREHAALQKRRDTCFSQALTTMASGLLCWLCSVPGDIIVKVLSSGLGPLCGFEGLLSLYSTEKAMWGDMVVAVEDLQAVVFTLTKVGHSSSAVPQVSGTRGSLIVSLPVSDSLYNRFVSKEHLSFTITAVFFNVGINEKATLAEALGETAPQHHSNRDNLERLSKYYYKYCQLFNAHIAAARMSSRTKPLDEVMESLRMSVHKKVPKNVEVLHLAALATRLMNGVRFTSCKSAKDRTGMSTTLEQCSILASEYHLAEHERRKALSIMRSEGCRRENTQKNIGTRKYAFTKKQVMDLPLDYQPPPGTYGSSQT